MDWDELLDTCVGQRDLAQFVGRQRDFDHAEHQVVEAVLEAALVVVGQLVSPANRPLTEAERDAIPQEVLRLAVLTAASELWHRRNSPGGVMATGADGATPVRLSWDISRSVRPLLGPFMVAV